MASTSAPTSKEEETFRTRAAIRETVELSATAFANRTGIDVNIFGVMGGYEARSANRGEPKGSHRLLSTVTTQKVDAPAGRTVPETKAPDAPADAPKPAAKLGAPAQRKAPSA